MTQESDLKGKTLLLTQEKQVRWFSVRQLISTALQTLAATVVGSMSGRRELMSALDPEMKLSGDYSDQKELWLDYVADAGDGWNATMSVAWLLGRDAIALRKDRKETPQPISPTQQEVEPQIENTLRLQHGQVLVFGGDEIYPTASAEAYQSRLVDPYQCARYYQKPERDVYALPGNHDWYDGLTSFIRLFCPSQENRRWLGAWGTRQKRSYFAIKLPHGWWLWGVDMALEDDLDPSQYEYFHQRAQELEDDDQVILCLPTPVWLKRHNTDIDQMQYRMARKLEIIANLVDQGGRNRAPVYLTGDNHHYAHYISKTPTESHYIVCGGGGAFGLGTLQLPPAVNVVTSKNKFVKAECESRFPDQDTSKKLRWEAVKFPLHNYTFSFFLACVHMISLWLLGAASAFPDGNWLMQLIGADLSLESLKNVCPNLSLLMRAPGLMIWLLFFLAVFCVFAVSGRAQGGSSWKAAAVGLVHGLLQIFGAIALFWLGLKLVAQVWPNDMDRWRQAIGIVLSFIFIFIYSGTLFGFYLVITNILMKLHEQEVFSAQGIEDYKSFLRMRITEAGLEIYSIGLKKSARRWRTAPGVEVSKRSGSQMRVILPEKCNRVFDPVDALSPHLIEDPIFIPRRKS
jgi:hypothetical protein